MVIDVGIKIQHSKCNVLHHGFSHQQYIYYLSGAAIQPVLSVRDLAVTIDHDLPTAFSG